VLSLIPGIQPDMKGQITMTNYTFKTPSPVALPVKLNKADVIPVIREALQNHKLQRQNHPSAMPAYGSEFGPCAIGACIPLELAQWLDQGSVQEKVAGGYCATSLYAVNSLIKAGVIETDSPNFLQFLQGAHDRRDWEDLENLLDNPPAD